jgi:hypothetical protein
LALKASVRAGITRHWVEQIIGLLGVRRVVCQLAAVTVFGEISIEQAGEQFVGDDRLRPGFDRVGIRDV